jgi:hypothetical protein
MARLRTRRLVIFTVLTLFFVTMLATVALAWNATCDAGEACVWKHGGFVVPRGAQATGDSDYGNNNYPNTQENMNDSVSSIRNRFGQKDVVWFFNAGHSGTSFCLNAGFQSGDLNAHNDEYSSHLIAVSSTC